MRKFAKRVQMKRKARSRRADTAHAELMAIYDRATQGGSEGYLVVNQPAESREPASGDLSFRHQGSRFAGPLGYRQANFVDSRGRRYTRNGNGTVYRAKQN